MSRLTTFTIFTLLLIIGIQSQDTEVPETEPTPEAEAAPEIEVIPVRDPNNIVIAYGSCLSTFDESSDIDQSIGSIIQAQSDVWMWLGDAIYLDGESFFFGVLPGPGYDVSDEDYTRNTFNDLKDRPIYTELRNNARIIGTWDDHDYAYDDADSSFEFKQRNMGIYLDFLDEPAESPRRTQQGVYTSYYVGEDRLIKIILLDIRYNLAEQSTISSLTGEDTTDRFDDMLGEEQWAWLDTQLDDTTATYTLIASGTQFLPDDRPIIPNWYQNSKDRLLDLIRDHQKSGVVLLSGDVHFAEMIRHPCPNRVGYNNLYEFTSSGLTHSAEFIDVFDGVIETYSGEGDRYFEKNFAVLRFTRAENSTDPPNLVFEARDIEGNVVLTREVPYGDLVFDQGRADSYTNCDVTDTSDSEGGDDTSEEIVDTIQDVVDDDDEGNDGDGDGDVGLGDVVDVIEGDADAGDIIDNIFSKQK